MGAQRRRCQGHHLQAVKKITAKTPRTNFLQQVPVGGGNDANIKLLANGSTHSSHSFFLHKTQQAGLNINGQLAYFVQKQGAAVRLTNIAAGGRISTRKGAFDPAEQFCFNQVGRDSTAVHGDKRFVKAAAEIVHRMAKYFLARPALAGNQHRGIRTGNFLYGLHDSLHFL